MVHDGPGTTLGGRVQNVMQGQDTNAVTKTEYAEMLYLLTSDTNVIVVYLFNWIRRAWHI
jgi:hypothetical protein